jgi:hypothetical protein
MKLYCVFFDPNYYKTESYSFEEYKKLEEIKTAYYKDDIFLIKEYQVKD